MRAQVRDVGFPVAGDFTLKVDPNDAGLPRFAQAERTAWCVEPLLRSVGESGR